jgi:hypothetical protein
VGIGCVLTAIDFNDYLSLAANKIDDVWPDRFLTNKFMPMQRARTQTIPKAQFGVG